MNIIIDVTRLVRRTMKGRMLTGIDRVTMAYVQHFKSSAIALVRWCGHSWVLSKPQSEALFQWLTTRGSALTGMRIMVRGILLGRTVINNTPTFLLNTGHISERQTDYVRMMKKQGVKLIFFVHDLIPIAYPEYCSPGEDLRHKEKMNYILTRASGVITNSDATRQDLIQYAYQTNQTMPPAEVALLAPGFIPACPGEPPLSKPYFVILGTIEARKNHALLLQIWRNLVMHFGEKAPHLVLIGQRGWECENALDLLERCPHLEGFVTELSHCSDADLITYIHHSRALLFPSFIEGYGLPLIEALTLGVPVLASDLPVFREIAGDIPEYIDPLDGKRWGELIMEYAKLNSAYRDAQRLRMRHFKSPTWVEHFVRIDLFLDGLSEENLPYSSQIMQ